jgi:ornithine decarboxylase
MMTFDNADELHKVKKNHPNAKLVLRILADDSRSICKLGLKFGASLDITEQLLRTAKQLGLDVIGVSFHVGSGCFDATAFREAVIRARKVFDQAESIGYQFSLLDVGGGFPSNHKSLISFEEIASILGPAVDEMFPPNVRVISEPGRFFVASAFTLAVNITARRAVSSQSSIDGDIVSQESSFMYYVNDGVYGSFNCIMFDHAECEAKVLCRDGQYIPGTDDEHQLPKFKCSVWGPTCDSMDCITKNGLMPELNVGDWLYYPNMGAYTMCAASTFNGFHKSSIMYTNTEMK